MISGKQTNKNDPIMEQQELFNIEPIEINTEKRKPRGNRKFNRSRVKQLPSLVESMEVEVKKVSLLICKQPKTYRLVPCDWTEEQKTVYIASHYDEDGRFIFDPPSDFGVFGGIQTKG